MEASGLRVDGPGPRVEGKAWVVWANPAPALVAVVLVGEPVLVRLVEPGLPGVPVKPVVPADCVVGLGFPAATVASGTERNTKNVE